MIILVLRRSWWFSKAPPATCPLVPSCPQRSRLRGGRGNGRRVAPALRDSGEAGGRYLSQGIGHDRIHAIVYTFSNQYTILPALMNDTKELRSVFVEAIREDFLGHLLFCHKLRNNPYLWQGTSLPLRKQAHISSGKHLLRSLLS